MCREVKGGCGQRVQQGLGTSLYYYSQGEPFGISGLRPDWSIQTKRSGVLVRLVVFFSKGPTRRRLWEVEESAYHMDCWGSHIKNLHLLVSLQTFFSGLYSQEELELV